MSDERWLPVVGYEGSYEVSDLGRVRSLERVGWSGPKVPERILAAFAQASGHLRVTLHSEGRQRTALVHRLALTAFAGPPPEGIEGRHMNGTPSDNSLANLRWGTHKQNMQDQKRHGTHRNTVKTHCPSGHPYNGSNLALERGGRRCLECKRAGWRKLSARRTQQRKGAGQ